MECRRVRRSATDTAGFAAAGLVDERDGVVGELKLTIEGHEAFVTPDVAHHLFVTAPVTA